MISNRGLLLHVLLFLSVLMCGQTAHSANARSKKATAPEVLQKALDAFNDYEFDEAADFLDEYRTMQTKAKKPLGEEFEALTTKVANASNAFDRVQKIVIIDSISMPRSSFFKAFNLSSSAGKIGRSRDFKLPVQNENQEVGLLSEGKDYLITASPNEDGEMVLIENRCLLDGSWETQEALFGDFTPEGNYAFPFMAGDGVTLYFANDGENSMGGYDLFVAQRDPISGESLQPLNLGMPFNSPYDDLLLAIDEENGIGWWATDRNSPGEDITVYVYILDDVRKNYQADTENLKEFAKVSNFKATWEEGNTEKYQEYLNKIRKN